MTIDRATNDKLQIVTGIFLLTFIAVVGLLIYGITRIFDIINYDKFKATQPNKVYFDAPRDVNLYATRKINDSPLYAPDMINFITDIVNNPKTNDEIFNLLYGVGFSATVPKDPEYELIVIPNLIEYTILPLSNTVDPGTKTINGRMTYGNYYTQNFKARTTAYIKVGTYNILVDNFKPLYIKTYNKNNANIFAMQIKLTSTTPTYYLNNRNIQPTLNDIRRFSSLSTNSFSVFNFTNWDTRVGGYTIKRLGMIAVGHTVGQTVSRLIKRSYGEIKHNSYVVIFPHHSKNNYDQLYTYKFLKYPSRNVNENSSDGIVDFTHDQIFITQNINNNYIELRTN